MRLSNCHISRDAISNDNMAFEHVDVVSRVKCEHEYAPQCIKKTQQMIKTQMEIEVINQKYSQIKTETNVKTSIPTKNKFTQMKKKKLKKKYLAISVWRLWCCNVIDCLWIGCGCNDCVFFSCGRCWIRGWERFFRFLQWIRCSFWITRWHFCDTNKIFGNINGHFTMRTQIIFRWPNITTRRRTTCAERTARFCTIAHWIETDWFTYGAQRWWTLARRFLIEFIATVERWWVFHVMIVIWMEIRIDDSMIIIDMCGIEWRWL